MRQRVVEVVEAPLRRPLVAQRGSNQSCPLPVWLSVRSPTMRSPRACAARDERARAPRRRRAAGRRGRSSSRRSGACCPRGRTASGRARSRRATRRGRGAASIPRRSPPNHSRGVVRPAAGRQLVPLARDRPGGRVARASSAARGEAVGEDLVDDGREVPVRARRVDREHEVVRVRRPRARRGRRPFSQRVAAVAAGEEPAVAGRAGSRPGTSRATTSPSRSPRRPTARAGRGSPSHDVAEDDVVARRRCGTRSAHDRVAAELVRPLEDVARRSRRGAAARAATCRRVDAARRGSSLDRALREPADDEPLEGHEEDDDRDAPRAATPAANGAPVLRVLLVDEAAQAERRA